MKEYFSALFCALATISFFNLLAGKKYERLTRAAFAVIILYVTVFPLTELFSGLPQLPTLPLPPESGYTEDYLKTAEQAYELGIERAVCYEFGLKSGEVSAVAQGFEYESFTAEQIKITLRGSAVFADQVAIRDYVAEQMGCVCSVELVLS